ncbi:MAG: bifunctional metallophosphatase/5'-nucleotidase [Candidatus Xenobiia bacterium LiM19]
MIGDTKFPSNIVNIAHFQTGKTESAPLQGGSSASHIPAEELLQPVDMASIDFSTGNTAAAHEKKKQEPARPKEPTKKEDPLPSREAPAKYDSLIKIPIIHTNDLHGASRYLPELDKAVQKLKSVNPDAVLIDSGDAGNTANHSDPARFEKVVDFFNDNGYTAVAPGNHEFQWGKDVAIKEYFNKLKAKVVSANLLDRDTDKPLAGTVPYLIEDIKGVKIGFVGITTTKMATPQHPDMGKDLIALSEIDTLRYEINEMKKKGAQVIIGLIHKGINDIREEGEALMEDDEDMTLLEMQELALKVPDIDVIAAGHDHRQVGLAFDTGPYPHKTYIVEAGSHGNEVGEIDLYVDPGTRKVIDADMKIYNVEKFVYTAEKAATDKSG